MPRAPRPFEWLLLLFPPAFRARFGDEMRATFSAVHAARRGRPLAMAALWIRTAGQAIVVAALEWRDAAGARRAAGPPDGARQEPVVSFISDVRTAARTLARSRSVAAAAVVTAALGVGANTAVFSAVDRVLWRPLAYQAPDRLVALWPGESMNARDVAFVRDRARAFASIATVAGWSVALTDVPDPTQLPGARVSASLFSTLGVAPLEGRTFVPADGRPGAALVVVLSHALWRTRFGGDPSIVGRSLTIDGEPHQVVGVMPPSFEILDPDAQLWIALREDPSHWTYTANISQVVGRLAPGATLGAADAEFRERLQQARGAFGLPDDYGRDASVVSLRERLVGGSRPMFRLLGGAAIFLLLIAASNLANLLLVRGEARRVEMAVRSALGATRGRLLQLVAADVIVLAAAGGLVGLGIAEGGVALIARLVPTDTPGIAGLAVDYTVLAGTMGFTTLAALVAALAPAATGRARLAPRVAAARTTAGPKGQAIRQAWIGLQVALAVVLVVGAGLMIRTLVNLVSADPGFDRTGVLTMRLYPTGAAYDTPGEYRRYYDEAIARVGALPGIEAASAIQHLPFSGISWGLPFEPTDQPSAPGEAKPVAGWRIIAGDYFDVMRIPLLQGRAFEPGDTDRAPGVAIVSASLARRYWPDGSALGRRLRLGRNGETGATIVGVVGDVRHGGIDEAPGADIYRPASQSTMPALMLAVRAAGDPARAADAVRAAVRDLDANVPISHVAPLDALVAGSFGRSRLLMTLLTAFATVALLLGAVGIYGVASFAVGRRTGEIGIRMALGASRGRIRAEVLRRSLAGAFTGIAAGLVAAAAAARLVAGLVYGVSPWDPATFAGVAAGMLIVALVAGDVPARRAAKVEPAAALRDV